MEQKEIHDEARQMLLVLRTVEESIDRLKARGRPRLGSADVLANIRQALLDLADRTQG